jgi:lipopolysaccharide/colanic/teichoic acid biosynthesis glycosyltransferase
VTRIYLSPPGWSERFVLDVEYVDTVRLRLDLQILARTIPAVFLRRGISAEGSATTTEFLGDACER